MKTRLVYILLFLQLVLVGYGQVREISLNSDNPAIRWEIKPQSDLPYSGQEIAQPNFRIKDPVRGIVPGVVFTAYVNQGLVPDPNFADNIYRVDEQLFNRPFWYRTTFRLPADYRKGQRVWIHFDNTNRYADFFCNGVKLSGVAGSTKDVSGHMLRSKFDITDLVREGQDNAIAVLITDADQKKTRTAKEPFGVTASPTYLAAAGWDWMPYVPGRLAGITGNVSLRFTGDVSMEDPWMRSDLESNEFAYLDFWTDLKNTSDQAKEITLEGIVMPGDIRFSKKVKVAANSTQKVYITRNEVKEFLIKQPLLWWPNGYGDPNLYSCSLTAKTGDEISDQKQIQFGIRKYEYHYVRNKAGWPVLNFYINGKKIYLKGGNWGMSEYLLRCQGEEYGVKVKLHKDMNYNMIRLWAGSITDDAFYDYCDRYGIMVWDDFWLYVAYNDVANDEDFKANALDKVKRLRNHASIAIWCGANETRPKPELDNYLRAIVASEDHNDRLYKSSSNQDGLSGSGWWGNQPPRHHFETSGSNLAWNDPPYPYSSNYGYGLRTEIGTATFPNYESIVKFIPKDKLWPLPTDEQLKSEDENVWNRHFFGKEASNASPIQYKDAVNKQYGESTNLAAFAEKAQYLNLEVMKGMYEAWNDKLWDDAAGMLIWMSQSAYPSFVWQTYDYYYDATGAYWGAKKACEPVHVQWNAFNNSVKVINTSLKSLDSVWISARIFDMSGKEIKKYDLQTRATIQSNVAMEVFRLNFDGEQEAKALSDLHYIKLTLKDRNGVLLSENFYWRNGRKELDYTSLTSLPKAKLEFDYKKEAGTDGIVLRIVNSGTTVSFGNRLRLVDAATNERILPLMISDNYFTLMPGEEKFVRLTESHAEQLKNAKLLWKQYGHAEKETLKLKNIFKDDTNLNSCNYETKIMYLSDHALYDVKSGVCAAGGSGKVCEYPPRDRF